MNTTIEKELHSLRTMLDVDFVAIAVVNGNNRECNWQYVVGNSNNRYKHMNAKPGVGLSGKVVRFGTDILLDGTDPNLERKRMDSPIMLAENLHSAFAAPIIFNNEIIAVILIGSRTIRTFSESEKNLVLNRSNTLALIMNSDTIIHEKLNEV